MSSNYKSTYNAYFSHRNNTRENFDLTHDQVHTLETAVDKNYEKGGAFGYICVPERKEANSISNFPEEVKTECRPAFLAPGLVDKTDTKTLNSKTYQGQQYFVFTDQDIVGDTVNWTEGVVADVAAGVEEVPAQNWNEFSGL